MKMTEVSERKELEEGEIEERPGEGRLRLGGILFWKEQQRGKKLSWGDWCADTEQNVFGGIKIEVMSATSVTLPVI
jgi:hypothetical protein